MEHRLRSAEGAAARDRTGVAPKILWIWLSYVMYWVGRPLSLFVYLPGPRRGVQGREQVSNITLLRHGLSWYNLVSITP